MADPTGARRGTHRSRAQSLEHMAGLGRAGMGLLQTGPRRSEKEREAPGLEALQGLGLLSALAFRCPPPPCRDVGTVSQAGVSPSMSSLPSVLPYQGRKKGNGSPPGVLPPMPA